MDFSSLSGFRGAGFPTSPPARKGGANRQHKKQCNCKNSRCLKLYCECFASGKYCDNCNCSNCYNNHENELTRQAAVEATLERNPNAFRPKIQGQNEDNMPGGRFITVDGFAKHSKGCNCKKSACLKKYCECFQAGVFCSNSCKCIECRNYEGSEQRAAVLACISLQAQGLDPPPSLLSPSNKRARTNASRAVTHDPSSFSMRGQASLTLPQTQLPPLTTQPQQTLIPQRPVLHQVVSEIVKGSVVDELCRLLFLVADEEGQKAASQQSVQQQTQQQQQHQETQPEAGTGPRGSADNMDGMVSSNGQLQIKMEGQPADTNGQAPNVSGQTGDGSGPTMNGIANVRAAVLAQAQEKVVLEEFLNMFKKMVDTAHKKAAQQQSTAAAAAAAAAAVVAATTGSNPNTSMMNYGGGLIPHHLMAAAAAAAVQAINRPQLSPASVLSSQKQPGQQHQQTQPQKMTSSILPPPLPGVPGSQANGGFPLTTNAQVAAALANSLGMPQQSQNQQAIDAFAALTAAGGGGNFSSMMADIAQLGSSTAFLSSQVPQEGEDTSVPQEKIEESSHVADSSKLEASDEAHKLNSVTAEQLQQLTRSAAQVVPLVQ